MWQPGVPSHGHDVFVEVEWDLEDLAAVPLWHGNRVPDKSIVAAQGPIHPLSNGVDQVSFGDQLLGHPLVERSRRSVKKEGVEGTTSSESNRILPRVEKVLHCYKRQAWFGHRQKGDKLGRIGGVYDEPKEKAEKKD